MTCSSCGHDRAITMHHRVVIWRRVVEWVECVRCYLEAEKLYAEPMTTRLVPRRRTA